MSIWAGLKRAVAVLGSIYEALTKGLTEFSYSPAEYNRSVEARLESEKIPTLEMMVKALEAEVARPAIWDFSLREVV